MKAVKIVLGLIVLLLVLAVGIFAYLAGNINDIVKDVIESEGSKITQTDVTLGGVNIELRQGRGELADLKIANPEGYTSETALHAKQLALQIEPGSVVDDVIVINEVVIQGVSITAEQKGLTTNLQALLRSIQEATASDAPAEQKESDLRLMVEKIRFADSAVNLVTEKYGNYELKLPSLELNDIGTRERGLTPAELGQAILQPLLDQARDAATQKLKERAKDEAETRLKDKAREKLGDDVEENVDKLRGLLN